MGSGQAAGRPGCAGASVPKGTLKPPEGRFGLRPMGGKSRKSEQKATARLPWVESRATRTQKYIIKRKMMQDRYGIEIKEI